MAELKAWWRRAKRRFVRVCDLSKLTAGQQIRFSDGRVYRRTENGNLVRVAPLKPWGNKAERKKYLKARRLKRTAGLAAEEPVYGTYE